MRSALLRRPGRSAARGLALLLAAPALVVAAPSGAGAAPAAAAAPTPECLVNLCTVTFTATGALQEFTVPSHVTSLRIVARGGEGGSATVAGLAVHSGGLGGLSGANVDVTPGSTLDVAVGSAGTDTEALELNVSGRTGGFPGGGRGGSSNAALLGNGGSGGGGGSLVSDASGVLVAAGGGGGASSTSDGGAGGGVGVAGTAGEGAGAGTGASDSVNGTGGPATGDAAAGQAGTGPATSATFAARGGSGGTGTSPGAGGGSGYRGGGGGSNGGGGGGGGYAAPGASVLNGSAGTVAGDGSVTITYPRPTPDLGLAVQPETPRLGSPVDLVVSAAGAEGAPTGTVDVTATSEGRDVPLACDDLPLTGAASPTSATCTTDALPAGTSRVQVSYSGDSTYGSLTEVAVGTVEVAKKAQTITFPRPKAMKVGQKQRLRATTSSGLKVVYRVSGARTCSVTGATLRARKPGRCVVVASSRGDGEFAAAAPVRRTVKVTPRKRG